MPGLIVASISALISVIAFLVSIAAKRAVGRAALNSIIRPRLEGARDFFDAVIEEEGTGIDSAKERLEQDARRLEESEPGLTDRELKTAVREVLAAWKELLSVAKPEPGPMVTFIGDPQHDLDERERDEATEAFFASQPATVEAAQKGAQAASRALNRLSVLQMRASAR